MATLCEQDTVYFRVAPHCEGTRRRGSGTTIVHINEWQQTGARHKQPYFIRPRDGGLFSFAGLWEEWHDPHGEIVQSCTILTTEANDVMRPLHDRMPVILDPTSDALWLNPGADAATLHSLLVPYPGERVEAFPVDTWVNSPKHEGPRCLESA